MKVQEKVRKTIYKKKTEEEEAEKWRNAHRILLGNHRVYDRRSKPRFGGKKGNKRGHKNVIEI